ncbi:hypothetical protein [Vreelandella sp. EE27]
MNKWQRRVGGTLAVAGGGIGAVSVFSLLFNGLNIFNWLFFFLFLALYSGGIVCGIKLIEGHANAEKANFLFWLCQIPLVFSPVAGYFFASGLYFTVWFTPGTLDMGTEFFVGSVFRYSLFESHQPLTLGVNLVAIAMSVWFFIKMPGKTRQANAPEQ